MFPKNHLYAVVCQFDKDAYPHVCVCVWCACMRVCVVCVRACVCVNLLHGHYRDVVKWTACTVCGEEWDFILGEADAKGTEELPV